MAIASLKSSNESLPYSLLLRNAAVSTSWDAEQHVEISGIRYSHLIDPKSGVALTGRRSVTVVAPDGATSDALATAVSVLGPDLGLKVIDSTQHTACLFTETTSKEFHTFESKRWRTIQKVVANQRLIH